MNAPRPVLQAGGRVRSRAAYRGDKLTKRVWQEILQADADGEGGVEIGRGLVMVVVAGAHVEGFLSRGLVTWVIGGFPMACEVRAPL